MVFVKTLLFVLVVPGFISVGIPYFWLIGRREWPLPELGPLRLLGWLPIALGAALLLRSAWDFSFTGKGTPAIWDAPKVFVAKGWYRYVRNPMYVGVILIVSGEAVVFEAWNLAGYALFLGLVFHLFVVLYEEPTLRKKFGATYEQYLKRVPRWIPTLKRGP